MQLEPEHPHLQPERPRVKRADADPKIAPPPLPPQAPVRPPQRGAPRASLAALVLLIAGAIHLWMGLDVKRESNVPAPGTPEISANQIVVDLRDSVSESEIAAINVQFGIQLEYNSVHARRHKLMTAAVPSTNSSTILAALRQSPLVEAADANYVRREFASTWKPNDPFYSQQWHLKMIGLEQAWVYTRGSGATVAVLDSGVGGNDPKTWRRLKDFASTKFANGYDFVFKDDIPEDAGGHGTHVAGTIAESTNNNLMGAGVAPDATIMPLRVLGPRGGSDADVVDALHYAADNGANVVNMSLGGPGPSQVLQLACQYAVSKGTTLICAAGNDGRHGVSYPAKLPECIAVAAFDPQGKRSYYSNYGPEIDIAGPGGDLKQGPSGGIWQNTINARQTGMFSAPTMVEGFYSLQGTSMAAPHVAGVAALLVSMGVRQPDEIRSILRRSATNVGSDEEYGAGLLDAAAAMKATGRSPYERYYAWAALAIGAALLFVFTGRAHFLTALMFLALGYYLPLLIERKMGFGSPWNLIGHSVLLPVIWLLTPRLTNWSLVGAASLTLGLGVHFMLDIWLGISPLPVRSPSRTAFWYLLNLAIGAYLVISAAVRSMPAKPLKSRRRKRPAYA